VSVPVVVAGAVCTMHCGSVICPVPFLSRLITTHTSTTAAVVNNTMFYDATRSSWRLVARPITAIAATMASFNSAYVD